MFENFFQGKFVVLVEIGCEIFFSLFFLFFLFLARKNKCHSYTTTNQSRENILLLQKRKITSSSDLEFEQQRGRTNINSSLLILFVFFYFISRGTNFKKFLEYLPSIELWATSWTAMKHLTLSIKLSDGSVLEGGVLREIYQICKS